MLDGVSAIGPNDVWAVGYFDPTSRPDARPLALHWDGTRWSIVHTPKPIAAESSLFAVSASSSDDIWAVGDSGTQQGTERVLTEHWNGAHWSIAHAIEPGRDLNRCYGVADLGGGDAWAVGVYGHSPFGAENGLVERTSDGSAWQRVAVPVALRHAELDSVSGSGPDDVWLVGTGPAATETRSVTAHWDGTRWALVANRGAGASSVLAGVSDVGPRAVWAVGQQADASGHAAALRQLWTGARWVDR